MVNDDPRNRPTPEATEDAAQRGQPRLRVVGEDVYPDWDAIYLDNVTRIYPLMYAKVGNRSVMCIPGTVVQIGRNGPRNPAGASGLRSKVSS